MTINGTEYERALIRKAMLTAQSEWLEESDRDGAHPAERTIALVIADAFKKEAEKYKETSDNDERKSNLWDYVANELGSS